MTASSSIDVSYKPGRRISVPLDSVPQIPRQSSPDVGHSSAFVEDERDHTDSDSDFEHWDEEEALTERFEVLNNIGSGVDSIVVQARDIHTQDECAIKLVCKTALYTFSRFQREVQILSELDHPHVIQLYEAFIQPEYYAIVMEVMRGGQLYERLAAREKYTEVAARKVMHQLLLGVDYLHKKNIAHRDLKPENVLFASIEENSPLKITDFGFADMNTSPGFRVLCGTPLYMAPEMLAGEDYDTMCDVWSLGVMMFILLCGYPPFYAATATELQERILNVDYSFETSHWISISSQAKDCIACMLCRDPTKRWSCAKLLTHPWIVGAMDVRYARAGQMTETLEELRRYNAIVKLRKGVDAVVAVNRIKKLVGEHCAHVHPA